MDLSQQNITGHQFDLNRRGYDPDAVDEHLREVAAAVTERDAEVAGKDRQLVELKQQIAELEAKVQDADESEEALRLTLKAAAHAKEELLAAAREQAAVLESEAAEKAERVVAEAQASARAMTDEANARASAMTEGARERAREVARAALSESELLVVRIEQLRAQVEVAEDSLRTLNSEASPRLLEARQGLDRALEAARASAENPELLAAAAEPQTRDHQEGGQVPTEPQRDVEQAAAAEDLPQHAEEPAHAPEVKQPPAEDTSRDDDAVMTAEQPAVGEAAAPGVEESDQGKPGETSADISDKVDRLLEELREVT